MFSALDDKEQEIVINAMEEKTYQYFALFLAKSLPSPFIGLKSSLLTKEKTEIYSTLLTAVNSLAINFSLAILNLLS